MLYLMDKDEEEIDCVELSTERHQEFHFDEEEEEESESSKTEEQEEAEEDLEVEEVEEIDVEAKSAEVMQALNDLYQFALYVRSLQYCYEMRAYHVDEENDEQAAYDSIVGALDALKEKIDGCDGMDLEGLEDNEQLMGYRSSVLDYARGEVFYLRSRADKRSEEGPRSASECYAKVARIEWETDNRMEAFCFHYTDGLTRKWGNVDEGYNGGDDINHADGEFIWSIKFWETGKEKPAEGIRFVCGTPDENEDCGFSYRDVDGLGDKCSRMLGGLKKCDQKWNMEGNPVVDFVFSDDGEWNLETPVAQEKACPDGSWLETVGDNWHFEGYWLVVPDRINGVDLKFIPLPRETLAIENGCIVVEKQLM